MARGQLVWGERFLEYDFRPHHPFAGRSGESAVRLLESRLPVDGPVDLVRDVPVPATGYLESFHRPEYLDLVERASRRTGAPVSLDAGDTPSFTGCFEAAARIAEGAARAVDFALVRRAPSFHPAGGLHHARPDR